MFQSLFEPLSIGSMQIPNRFVRSATFDAGADVHGNVTPAQVELLSQLAEGKVGLIISGIASVHPSGRISPYQLDVSHDGCIPGLSRIAEAVHASQGKIAVQLFHAGREGQRYQKHLGNEAQAPSYISEDPYCTCTGKSMSEDEIMQVIEAFGSAAVRAKKAGVDGVQVHGAHAYLVSQFLSPYTNQRTDRWGGSLENRFAFLRCVYEAIRSQVGSNYPIMIKLGVADGFPEGLSFTEGRQVAIWCNDLGFDAIEISQGLRGTYYQQTEFRTGIIYGKNTAYFRDWTRNVRQSVQIPIIMVGGLRSPHEIGEYINQGECDCAAFCRPLIKEPDLVASWKEDIDRHITCISCNKCFEAVRKGSFLHCALSD